MDCNDFNRATQAPSADHSPNAPTMYFVGVTTGGSAMRRIFPCWAASLGLNAQLAGYDAPIHAPPEVYREIVNRIKRDPLAMGALVTTHKIDVLAAARDLFDELDPDAQLCSEVSCIRKVNGKLVGSAVDPTTCGLAWESFVDPGYFGQNGAKVLCLGAGGAAVALAVYLARRTRLAERPTELLVINRSPARLAQLRATVRKLDTNLRIRYVHNSDPAVNDALLANLPAGSIVVNATGMGKDTPGSPITPAATFPEGGGVWELNYRGELDFLRQAELQRERRHLRLEDGWTYFLFGWTRVIAEIFQITIDPDQFAELGRVAAELR